jgi:hypothetical protein
VTPHSISRCVTALSTVVDALTTVDNVVTVGNSSPPGREAPPAAALVSVDSTEIRAADAADLDAIDGWR